MATGMKAYATDTMLPLLDNVAKVAPPELDTAVSTFRTQLQKLAETGDPSVFSDPQLEAAGATAHAFDQATCKWNTINVELQDYSFSGAPARLTALLSIEEDRPPAIRGRGARTPTCSPRARRCRWRP